MLKALQHNKDLKGGKIVLLIRTGMIAHKRIGPDIKTEMIAHKGIDPGIRIGGIGPIKTGVIGPKGIDLHIKTGETDLRGIGRDIKIVVIAHREIVPPIKTKGIDPDIRTGAIDRLIKTGETDPREIVHPIKIKETVRDIKTGGIVRPIKTVATDLRGIDHPIRTVGLKEIVRPTKTGETDLREIAHPIRTVVDSTKVEEDLPRIRMTTHSAVPKLLLAPKNLLLHHPPGWKSTRAALARKNPPKIRIRTNPPKRRPSRNGVIMTTKRWVPASTRAEKKNLPLSLNLLK